MNQSELGVGLVFWPALEPLLRPDVGLIDVVEIEPQAFWREMGGEGGPLRVESEIVSMLKGLPQAKLVHGVGCPIGGTLPLDERQLPLLKTLIEELDAAWMSEHLSFNRARRFSGSFHALFLLPPCQTPAGARAAAAAIRALAGAMPVPLAVETGVNYLRPRPGDLSDGQFIADVVEAADCGILLDLHNLMANERNGRQPVLELLEELPLDRVWEVHVAGGVEQQGYWLDAHSGEMCPELVELCHEVVPRLTQLRAIIFELFPIYIPRMGLDRIAKQMEVMRNIWDRRATGSAARRRPVTPRPRAAHGQESPVPDVWETTLARLVVGDRPMGELSRELEQDPGIGVYRKQIRGFRRGMVTDGLTMTVRLLLMSEGDTFVERLFEEYWKTETPSPFVATEARRFASFLKGLDLDVPYLADVIAIELAKLTASVEEETTTVSVSVDPIELMRALGSCRIPEDLPTGRFELEVVPDEQSDAATSLGWSGAS